jgi:hypothetical protein
MVCQQSAVPLTLAAFFAGVSPALAQDTIMESQISFYVQTSAGQPTVCGIEFALLYRERTYRQGAFTGLKGTISWIEKEGEVGVVLKLGAFDLPTGSHPPQIFRIPNALLSAGGKPIPLDNIFPCDGQPMALCGMYWMPASLYLYQAVIVNTLSINFQREQNGLDVSLSIDTQSAALEKPQEYNDFSTCMVALADRAKRNLKR